MNKDIRDAFFDEIYEIAKKDNNVIFITDDMDAFGLRRFREDFPDRFINIGVAEQNMIDVAAGLAACGKKVFVYGICSYVTMRCFEQIKFSVCGMNLPVTVIGVGAGFSFAFDGPTHHGTQDVAIMRALPEMSIYNPSDAQSAARAAWQAYEAGTPAYVRLDKGVYPVLYGQSDRMDQGFKVLRPAGDVTLVSTGFMTHAALRAAEILKETQGMPVGVIDLYRIKPFDIGMFRAATTGVKTIVTVEENSIIGGIGSLVAECVAESGGGIVLKRIAVPAKQYAAYGSREWFHKTLGLLPEDIAKAVSRLHTVA